MHRRTLLTVVAIFFLASSARAEVILTPFIGAVFGGSTDASHTAYGGAVGFLGGGLFGFEAEFGYIKDYFGTGPAAAGLQSNKLQSLSGNLILAFPSGPFRPYGTAGLGLLRPELTDRTGFVEFKQDKGAFNVGGGIFLGLGNHLALRGDLRYFRAFSDLEAGVSSVSLGSLDYWRGVGGLTLRF
jgi:hypothetical protein